MVHFILTLSELSTYRNSVSKAFAAQAAGATSLPQPNISERSDRSLLQARPKDLACCVTENAAEVSVRSRRVQHTDLERGHQHVTDATFRRFALALMWSTTTVCLTLYSLALSLASRYLADQPCEYAGYQHVQSKEHHKALQAHQSGSCALPHFSCT